MLISALEEYWHKRGRFIIGSVTVFAIVAMLLSVYVFLPLWNHHMKELGLAKSEIDSWRTTNTVCAPVVTLDDGTPKIGWDNCFQSTLSFAAIESGGHDSWVDLPDGHEYKPLFAYECFGYSNVSGLRFGLKPNLFDFMLADTLPKGGCRWSCDPTTEAECLE